MSEKKRRINLWLSLSVEEHDALQKLASDRHISMAECAREMITGKPISVLIRLKADPEAVRLLAEAVDRGVRLAEEQVLLADQTGAEREQARQQLQQLMELQREAFRALERWEEETIAVFKSDVASWKARFFNDGLPEVPIP